MKHQVKLRPIAPPERRKLKTLSQSRTAEARLTERARLILAISKHSNYSDVARQLHVSRSDVYDWIHRFNEFGLSGLPDQPRSGRPPTYTSDEVAEVIAASLTPPKELGLEFGSWTLDRLETYLNETKHIAIKRSRIDEILLAEGLKWRKQETWFGQKADPEFAEKRGSSISSIRIHRKTRPSSVLTKWDQKPRRASQDGN